MDFHEFGMIKDEDQLRRLWQETEDFGRKKEIRARMYKLREARLKEFYTTDMDTTDFSKTPITSRHGESMADQSFEHLKTKEIRDCASPIRENKFGISLPTDTSGWNITTSAESSADGKSHRIQSLATTDGVKEVTGGQTVFSGRNEQMASEKHVGDDKNFTHSTDESTKSMLKENTVIGDANNRITQNKSTAESSSSYVVKSQSVSDNSSAPGNGNGSKFSSSTEKFESQNVVKKEFVKSHKESYVYDSSNNRQLIDDIENRNLYSGNQVSNVRNNNPDFDNRNRRFNDNDNISTQYDNSEQRFDDSNTTSKTTTSKTITSNMKQMHEDSIRNISNKTHSSPAGDQGNPNRYIPDTRSDNPNQYTSTRDDRNTPASPYDNPNRNAPGLNNNNVSSPNDNQNRNTPASAYGGPNHNNPASPYDSPSQGHPASTFGSPNNNNNPASPFDSQRRNAPASNYGGPNTPSNGNPTHNIPVSSHDDKNRNIPTQSQDIPASTSQPYNKPDFSKEPARVQEAFRLAEQPGTIISRKVEYPNEKTVCITETKRLEDGTTVTTKRYETKGTESVPRSNDTDKYNNTLRNNRNADDPRSPSNRPSNDNLNTKTTHIINKDVEFVTNKFVNDNERHQSIKKDLSQDVKNEKYINVDNKNDQKHYTTEKKYYVDDVTRPEQFQRRPNDVGEPQDVKKTQPTPQPQPYVNRKISVEVNAAHEAFARSLRCVSPADNKGSNKSLRSNSTYDKNRLSHKRRSNSRDTVASDISKISTNTVTKTDVGKEFDFMRPTITSEIRSSTPKTPDRQPSPSKRPSRPNDENDQFLVRERAPELSHAAPKPVHEDLFIKREIDHASHDCSTHHHVTPTGKPKSPGGSNLGPNEPVDKPHRRSPLHSTPSTKSGPKPKKPIADDIADTDDDDDDLYVDEIDIILEMNEHGEISKPKLTQPTSKQVSPTRRGVSPTKQTPAEIKNKRPSHQGPHSAPRGSSPQKPDDTNPRIKKITTTTIEETNKYQTHPRRPSNEPTSDRKPKTTAPGKKPTNEPNRPTSTGKQPMRPDDNESDDEDYPTSTSPRDSSPEYRKPQNPGSVKKPYGNETNLTSIKVTSSVKKPDSPKLDQPRESSPSGKYPTGSKPRSPEDETSPRDSSLDYRIPQKTGKRTEHYEEEANSTTKNITSTVRKPVSEKPGQPREVSPGKYPSKTTARPGQPREGSPDGKYPRNTRPSCQEEPRESSPENCKPYQPRKTDETNLTNKKITSTVKVVTQNQKPVLKETRPDSQRPKSKTSGPDDDQEHPETYPRRSSPRESSPRESSPNNYRPGKVAKNDVQAFDERTKTTVLVHEETVDHKTQKPRKTTPERTAPDYDTPTTAHMRDVSPDHEYESTSPSYPGTKHPRTSPRQSSPDYHESRKVTTEVYDEDTFESKTVVTIDEKTGRPTKRPISEKPTTSPNRTVPDGGRFTKSRNEITRDLSPETRRPVKTTKKPKSSGAPSDEEDSEQPEISSRDSSPDSCKPRSQPRSKTEAYVTDDYEESITTEKRVDRATTRSRENTPQYVKSIPDEPQTSSSRDSSPEYQKQTDLIKKKTTRSELEKITTVSSEEKPKSPRDSSPQGPIKHKPGKPGSETKKPIGYLPDDDKPMKPGKDRSSPDRKELTGQLDKPKVPIYDSEPDVSSRDSSPLRQIPGGDKPYRNVVETDEYEENNIRSTTSKTTKESSPIRGSPRDVSPDTKIPTAIRSPTRPTQPGTSSSPEIKGRPQKPTVSKNFHETESLEEYKTRTIEETVDSETKPRNPSKKNEPIKNIPVAGTKTPGKKEPRKPEITVEESSDYEEIEFESKNTITTGKETQKNKVTDSRDSSPDARQPNRNRTVCDDSEFTTTTKKTVVETKYQTQPNQPTKKTSPYHTKPDIKPSTGKSNQNEEEPTSSRDSSSDTRQPNRNRTVCDDSEFKTTSKKTVETKYQTQPKEPAVGKPKKTLPGKPVDEQEPTFSRDSSPDGRKPIRNRTVCDDSEITATTKKTVVESKYQTQPKLPTRETSPYQTRPKDDNPKSLTADDIKPSTGKPNKSDAKPSSRDSSPDARRPNRNRTVCDDSEFTTSSKKTVVETKYQTQPRQPTDEKPKETSPYKKQPDKPVDEQEPTSSRDSSPDGRKPIRNRTVCDDSEFTTTSQKTVVESKYQTQPKQPISGKPTRESSPYQTRPEADKPRRPNRNEEEPSSIDSLPDAHQPIRNRTVCDDSESSTTSKNTVVETEYQTQPKQPTRQTSPHQTQPKKTLPTSSRDSSPEKLTPSVKQNYDTEENNLLETTKTVKKHPKTKKNPKDNTPRNKDSIDGESTTEEEVEEEYSETEQHYMKETVASSVRSLTKHIDEDEKYFPKPQKSRPDDYEPDSKLNTRRETYEERCKRMIGVTSVPEPKGPSSQPKDEIVKTSEIRERKKLIEKETQELDAQTTYSITTTVTDDGTTRVPMKNKPKSPEDFINLEKQTIETDRSKVPISEKPSNLRKPSTDRKNPTEKPRSSTPYLDDETEPAMSSRDSSPDNRKPKKTLQPLIKTVFVESTDEETKTMSKTVVSKQIKAEPEKPSRTTPGKTNLKPTIRETSPNSKYPAGKTPKTTDSFINLEKTTVESDRKNTIIKEYDVPKKLPDQSRPTPETTANKPLDRPKTTKATVEDSESEYITEVNDVKRNVTTKKNTVTTRKETAPVNPTFEKEKPMVRASSENPMRPKNKQPNDVNQKPNTKKPVKESSPIRSDLLENIEIPVEHIRTTCDELENTNSLVSVSTEEYTGKPRYPDTIHEPEDESPKRKTHPRVQNIPIFEEETNDYVGLRIEEVEDSYDSETREEEEEIIQSNVTEKISKFTKKAEEFRSTSLRSPNVKGQPVSPTQTKFSPSTRPTSKLTEERPTVTKTNTPDRSETTETFREDECLLSVSEKVNKFTTKADILGPSAPQKSPELVNNIIRKTSRPDYAPESPTSITRRRLNESVERLEEATTKSRDRKLHEPVERLEEPVIKHRDRTYKDRKESASTLIMRSTEAVKRAKEIFENNTAPKKDSPSVKPKDVVSRPSAFDEKRKTTRLQSDVSDVDSTQEQYRTSEPRSSSKPTTQKDSSPTKPKDILSRPSVFEEKRKTTRLHSDVSDVESTQEQFRTSERKSSTRTTTQKDTTPTKPKDIVSRPSVFEEKRRTSRTQSDVSDVESTHEHYRSSERRSSSRKMYQSDDNEEIYDRSSSRESNHGPSYMRQTISSIEHMKRRTSIDANQTIVETEQLTIQTNPRGNDSGRISVDEVDIEEIFDLEVLETMLEKVVGYEQRRRIRAQIRIVKKIVEEHLSKSSTVKKTQEVDSKPKAALKDSTFARRPTPKDNDTVTKTTRTIRNEGNRVIDEKVSTTERRRQSGEDTEHEIVTTTIIKKSNNVSPTRKSFDATPNSTSPVRRASRTKPEEVSPLKNRPTAKYPYSSQKSVDAEKNKINREPAQRPREVQPEKLTSKTTRSSKDFIQTEREVTKQESTKSSRSPSPKSSHVSSRIVEKTSITRTPETTRKVVTKDRYVTDSNDSKPVWANAKNILKTPSAKPETVRTPVATRKAEPKTYRMPDFNDDCITSSYGIGPTDENGQPLFGIRALKKKSVPTVTSKVSGSIVTENFYSENGATPTGERKTILYSSDANDLPENIRRDDRTPSEIRDALIEKTSRGKITSVTKTEKFGKTNDDDAILQSRPKGSAKVVRQGSVKKLTEKFTSNRSSESNSAYPKAGLILRSKSQSSQSSNPDLTGFKDDQMEFDESDVELRSEVKRRESKEYSSSSTKRFSSSSVQGDEKSSRSSKTRSFLNDGTKVTGAHDIIDRMRNADNVHEIGDTQDDQEARALLNKFLGASILMSGVESSMASSMSSSYEKLPNLSSSTTTGNKSKVTKRIVKSSKSSKSGGGTTETIDFEDIWDEKVLRQLLEASTNIEERRIIRARLNQIMADREACADVIASVTADLQNQQLDPTSNNVEETTTTEIDTQDVDGSVITTKKTVTTSKTMSSNAPKKPMSPFAKFQQLEKQNSVTSPSNSPKLPSSPTTPTSPGGGPYFKFTDPNLNLKAATIKDQLLEWCQMKTKEYENIQITNFSTCWSDGLAFCALIHHFLPDAFDYSQLTPTQRRYNFTLAFRVADEKAGIAPLLDVEDMVVMRKPDWKCVFTYVQSIYRRYRNHD